MAHPARGTQSGAGERLGLQQLNSVDAVRALCAEAIEGAPDDVARYRAGKTRVLGHMVGKVLKASQGRANPRLVQEVLEGLMRGG